ncbi:protein of unknown function DUF103 [Methanospirillum hungatei JF-1]|uniref:HEPN domain-containing protein n=1 Tax=Methanospirillum hungatei JF-1 (strain ATCC 27890 / DSM 864 / NBRC 100397 / JF-1) TaxID=323259 RepID=Q2FRS1_METHJ|nr:protein of unknown function DUF103 [Methanospirillum hungatei JF-1]OQA55400.1 MAG: HEPN domain protein [Euryarchaeota archaeon ADurb.Bin294]
MPNSEEISLFIRRAQETYTVACELHQNHHYNDAVSRAYYSMFYAAKAVLLTKDIITRTHRGTISQLNSNFVRVGEFEEMVWKYLPLSETLREKPTILYQKELLRKNLMRF